MPVAALARPAIALALAFDAHARPGGGSSYGGGGGGGGSGGGGSSGGGDLLGVLFWLVFSDLPWPLKVLVVGVIAIIFFVNKARRSRMQDWSSSNTGQTSAPWRPAGSCRRRVGQQPAMAMPIPAARTWSPRRQLEGLSRFDPEFSVVLFEDFLYALYANVRYATAGRIDRLSAYLAPDVLAAMGAARVAEVRTVIVGALRVSGVRGLDPGPGQVEVDLEIESNVAVVASPGAPERTSYLMERWTISRRKDARSRSPARARILACPGCGAPLDAVVSGTCTHRRRVVGNGDFDWVVRAAAVVQSEVRGPMLTTNVAERGNDLPTVVDPEAQGRWAAIAQRDPYFQWPTFAQRVDLVFTEFFQAAWTGRDLARMRPYFTDALFDTQRYWVEAYRSQGLRNVTDRARIEGLELARITSDKWFDAVTVRLSGAGLDYVVRDSDNKVLSGRTHKERRYTEYWTFIRGAGRNGPTRTAAECPSCGAPLAVGMAGDCRYCKAKVTTGEFDWVLSRIEQDEAYLG